MKNGSNKQRFRKLKALLVSAVTLNLFFAPLAQALPRIPEVEVPIQPLLREDEGIIDYSEDDRDIDYTEDLVEVTDDGIFDMDGFFTDFMELEALEDENNVLPEMLPDETAFEEELGEAGEDSFEAFKESIIQSWGGKKAFAEQRLKGVKENLAEQRQRFAQLEARISEAETRLAPLQEEINSLKDQITLLNNQIQTTKDKITNVEILIAETKIEIKDLMLNLKKSEIELGIQQKIVLDYIALLYEEEGQFLSLYDEGSSTMKLLLADNSVSENLLGQEYLSVMEETGRQVFYDLEKAHRDLIARQESIQDEQEDLQFLYEKLREEKQTLEETRLSKKDLLAKTQGDEEKYQLLLEESIQQQLESAIAIQNLQENVQLIESKLALLDDGLEEVEEGEDEIDFTAIQDDLELVESVETPDGSIINFEDEELDIEEIRTRVPFRWPVAANKITATFHDPTYPKRWGIHNAIDIRAAQFTEIHAPANAYVFQTKDNDMGYSYIILAHKNNLVTVYGHVSEIYAQPGTIVRKGEVIGLTGGTPGTKGAGLQTTGPHLHFEVHYKGDPQNPLDYLPLNELPIEYVPDEYLLQLK